MQAKWQAIHHFLSGMRDHKVKITRQSWLLAFIFLLLFIFAVPWYWGEGGEKPLILGMPLWVAVSVGVSFLISCLTAWTAFRTWQSDVDKSEGDK